MDFLKKKLFRGKGLKNLKKFRKGKEYLYRKQKEEIESINVQLPVSKNRKHK